MAGGYPYSSGGEASGTSPHLSWLAGLQDPVPAGFLLTIKGAGWPCLCLPAGFCLGSGQDGTLDGPAH